MDVEELFRQLSYGELSNLAIGGEGSGSIPLAQRPKLVSYVNDGLLQLYSRFVLKESDVIVATQEHITNYHFLKRFAASNVDPLPGDTLYIVDHADDPFQEDLIKILKVFDSEGTEYPLNDVDNPESLFTPQPNTLQIPYPIADEIVNVIYQAGHEQLPYDDLTACICLPLVLNPALKTYVAYKVYCHMNGQENAAKAAEHLTMFEAMCNQTTERDLVNSSMSNSATKFRDRGFR